MLEEVKKKIYESKFNSDLNGVKKERYKSKPPKTRLYKIEMLPSARNSVIKLFDY